MLQIQAVLDRLEKADHVYNSLRIVNAVRMAR